MGKCNSGSCLCGDVTYTVNAFIRGVMTCHCKQCQKTSGHYVAATAALKSNVEISAKNDSLVWYKSSKQAERGFCNKCGSSLFWHETEADDISIHAGTLDGPTGLQTETHIFMADKADYFDEPCGSTDVEAPKFRTYE